MVKRKSFVVNLHLFSKIEAFQTTFFACLPRVYENKIDNRFHSLYCDLRRYPMAYVYVVGYW